MDSRYEIEPYLCKPMLMTKQASLSLFDMFALTTICYPFSSHPCTAAATTRLSKAALAMSMSAAKVRTERRRSQKRAGERAGGVQKKKERKKGGSEARATKERRSPKARSHSGVLKTRARLRGYYKSQRFVHSTRGFSMRRRPP